MERRRQLAASQERIFLKCIHNPLSQRLAATGTKGPVEIKERITLAQLGSVEDTSGCATERFVVGCFHIRLQREQESILLPLRV